MTKRSPFCFIAAVAALSLLPSCTTSHFEPPRRVGPPAMVGTALPFLELRNRYEFPDRLVMYGAVQLTQKGVAQWQEFIVALALRDGRTRAWNVTLERSAPSAELEPAGRK